MQIITIYPTSIKIPEELGLEGLLQIDGFEELLANDIAPEREKVLIDRCQQFGIDIHYVVAPDGRIDETLIRKDALRVILETCRKNDSSYGGFFNTPSPQIAGIDTDELEKILPLLQAAHRRGVVFQYVALGSKDV